MRGYQLLVRAFPRGWRDTYGDELLRLLEEDPWRRWQGVDLVLAGTKERWHRLSVRADLQPESQSAPCRRGRRAPAWTVTAAVSVLAAAAAFMAAAASLNHHRHAGPAGATLAYVTPLEGATLSSAARTDPAATASPATRSSEAAVAPTERAVLVLRGKDKAPVLELNPFPIDVSTSFPRTRLPQARFG